MNRFLYILLVLSPALPGCGNDRCNTDTDCKMPQICIAGACVDMNQSDASIDSVFDLEVEGPQPDVITDDVGPEENIDVIEEDVEEEDIVEIIEEDFEEIELPPATIIWEDDFSDEPVEWEYQNGEWEVTGGEYVQGSETSFAEVWVPLVIPWEDFAFEVSLASTLRDTGAPRSVLGIMFRVQEISRNHYYMCGLDYNNDELLIVKYDQDMPPGYDDLCVSSGELSPALADDTLYKLQVVVSGTGITCRWIEGDVVWMELFTRDETYSAGSIGLFANKAAGRFDDVTVYDHRPPEWPAAETREICP